MFDCFFLIIFAQGFKGGFKVLSNCLSHFCLRAFSPISMSVSGIRCLYCALKLQRWNGTSLALAYCNLSQTVGGWQPEGGDCFGLRNYVLQLSGLMKLGIVQRQLHPPAVAGGSSTCLLRPRRHAGCPARRHEWVQTWFILHHDGDTKRVTQFQSKSSLSSKRPPAKPPTPAYPATGFAVTALVRAPMAFARTSAIKSATITITIASTMAAFIGSDNGIAVSAWE